MANLIGNAGDITGGQGNGSGVHEDRYDVD